MIDNILDDSGLPYTMPLTPSDVPEPPITNERPDFGIFAHAGQDEAATGGRHYNAAGYRLLAEWVVPLVLPE